MKGNVYGFTLVELLLASVAAAMIMVAIYSVFEHAIHLRDSATQRIHDSRQRERAAALIRNDLRNALVSGGVLASVVEGDSAGTGGMNSGFPGYLKFTTTTGKDTEDDLYGDVQQVEYYIVQDTGTTGLTNSDFSTTPSATDTTGTGVGGNLVRAVTRDLLETVQPQPDEQPILPNVQSMQVAFYDGTNWQSSWSYNTADSATSGSGGATTTGSNGSSTVETLPVAIRVDIQQAPARDNDPAPPPLEIMVPWTTQPFSSPAPAPSASP